MIKVILRKDISGFGKTGDVRQVKDGYARNYLLPRNLALLATEQNLKKIESERKKLEEKKTLEKKKAEGIAQQLANVSVTITVEVNEEGRLYGSLTEADVVKAMSAEGIDIDKNSVVLPGPVKEPGIYEVEIKLYPEVVARIKVWVVKK